MLSTQISSKNNSEEEGENPGYFEQWFNEKKNADGIIPSWQMAEWAKWDKSQVLSRTTENIVDSVIELGPDDVGGRTRALWIDPRNDNVILAGGISGGVWRSENGGKNWSPVNDQEATLTPSCFTHNPFNPDVIYYGTGEGRGNSAGYYIKYPGGNGIYKSTDGGKTFNSLPASVGLAGFDLIWDIQHSLTDSLTFFVATDNSGVYRTKDGGLSFEQVFTYGNNKATSLLVLPNDRILVGMYTYPVFASDSGGKKGTFTQMPMTGWPGGVGRLGLANCRKYPNVVYALLEGVGYSDQFAGFYKSSNGGKTWKKQSTPSIGTGQGGYQVLIGCSPTDSNVIVTGGLTIAQSNNGGTNWSNKTTGHSDHHAMIPFYTNTNFFIVGTDGGIYKYRFNSASIQEFLNPGYHVTQFYAGAFGPTGLVSISGAQDNGTHVATGKLTSRKFYGGDGAYCHIGLQDGSVAYVSTQNEGIRRIDNFNSKIAPSFSNDISDPNFSNDGVNFINSYAMNPADQYQLYYRTNRYVYRSLDGGDQWEKLTNLRSSLKSFGISNETNPVVYVGGGASQLYRINKAVDAKPGTEISLNSIFPAAITNDFLNSIVVHPRDNNTIFISYGNYSTQPRVWRISGLDTSKPVFQNISGNLPPNLPVNFIAIDPENPDRVYFAGTDFGLYYTTDGGTTWVKELRIPNVAIHEIKMRNDRTLFLYTHGRGMWALTLKTLSFNGVKTISKAAKVYPSPSKDYISIELEDGLKPRSYAIYNNAGSMVLQGNKLNDQISTEKLMDGYYYIRIETQNGNLTSRFLVQH